MYLLSLVRATDDLNKTWLDGDALIHYAAMSGDLPLIEALVQRRVKFHVYNVTEHTPIELAMHCCRLPVVRFLVGCYQQGQRGHDALRDMMSTAPEDEDGDPYPMIFLPIRQTLFPVRVREAPIFTPSDEERGKKW